MQAAMCLSTQSSGSVMTITVVRPNQGGAPRHALPLAVTTVAPHEVEPGERERHFGHAAFRFPRRPQPDLLRV